MAWRIEDGMGGCMADFEKSQLFYLRLGTTSPPKARSVVLLVRGAKWLHEELGYLSRYWCTTTSNWVHEVTPEPFKVPPRPLNSNLTPP